MRLYYVKDKDDDRDDDRCDRKKCSHRDDDRCCDDHKFAKCRPKNPCPYPILFECNAGTGGQVPPTGGRKTETINVPLGCVTIDTTCLKMPVVKFDFCSIVKVLALEEIDDPARITFTLTKTCDEGSPITCGSWNFIIDGLGNDEIIAQSFNFCHCECNSCPGCCTYSVALTSATNIDMHNMIIVESPVLSVIAKSSC